MLALRDLQTAFRRALLEEEEGSVATLLASIDGDDLGAERLAVYRNNVVASLTEALRDTFPVIGRLVGDGFFGYAAHEFIVASPPRRPALAEYGGAFADFLAGFAPCRDLAYLADVARFEWAMNEAATALEMGRASTNLLADIAHQDAAGIRFRLHASYRYVASPWPVDRIWRANQDGADEAVDLDSGGVALEISRQGEDAVFRYLDAADFAFRQGLCQGMPLGEALECALATTPSFPATAALAALFQEGAIVSIIHGSSDRERAP